MTPNLNNPSSIADDAKEGDSEQEQSTTHQYVATVTDFSPQVCGGFHIETAVASFVLKGEDKYAFVTTANEPLLEKSQPDNAAAKLVVFAGIFDGHDGALASEYCSQGLLHHVLAETQYCASKLTRSVKGDTNVQVLKQGHVNGFTWAQTRFGSGSNPPTFKDVKSGPSAVRNSRSFFQRLCGGSPRGLRGGTTATTVSLYTKKTEDEASANPLLCAIVACTGDSRCITDDGDNGPCSFREVTRDHRPSDEHELRRLKKYVSEGTAFVERDEYDALRLYPGGLAVSRTIGDLQLSHAAVPEPDVFSVALRLDNGCTYRFVIGSDGVWDTFDTDVVGSLAARVKILEDGTEKVTSAKEAARAIIDDCIKKGGYQDDVTVLVMDVKLVEGEIKEKGT